MVCTGNRQSPSFAFSANERERAEGAGLKELGLRCQRGEENRLQERRRNDPGNPMRGGARLSGVRSSAVSAGGAAMRTFE